MKMTTGIAANIIVAMFISYNIQPLKNWSTTSVLDSRPHAVNAQTSTSKAQTLSDPCSTDSTENELDDCAAKLLAKVDEELKRVYKRIVAQLEAVDRKHLLLTQRDWLRYRDINCTAQRQAKSSNPIRQPLCLVRSTESRIKELIRIYELLEEDLTDGPVSTSQDPCPGASTQEELNICAAKRFRMADDEMNRVYERIRLGLASDRRVMLVQAQRVWMKYRDLDCQAEAKFKRGSLAPTRQGFCLRDITEDRTKDLIRIYGSLDSN
jgi:uncharacterized protein YecT (DUF1311 family)